MNSELAESTGAGRAALRGSFDPRALAALFGLSLRQFVRCRRLLILAFLFSLPALVAILARATNEPRPSGWSSA